MRLPAAFFCGISVQEVTETYCKTTVRYKWQSKNPFKSTYFACLAMAAEMSTGILAMANTYRSDPAISMLVTGLEAIYHKKATGITIFTCEDGIDISKVVALAITTGEPQIFRATSIGKNSDGELIAEFFIRWSFKAKR
jgi:hypothetical protein